MKLHQFLQGEEAARIAVLRKEMEQKSQILKKKIEELDREILYLTASVRSVSGQIQADDIVFLQVKHAVYLILYCSIM